MIIAQNLKREFLNMTHDQLSDYKFLSEFIFNEVGLALNIKVLRITNGKSLTCWGGLSLRQYPEEIAKLLVFLYKHKEQINSYCEIGVSSGGTFFVIDSFLRAINPSMGSSLGIDNRTIARYAKKLFNPYKENTPGVSFLEIDSIKFKPTENYDFCFVDADHSYNGCSRDFNLMKNYSKIIAFHDIKLENSGSTEFWQEIKNEKSIELLNEDPRFPAPLGIGIICNFD